MVDEAAPEAVKLPDPNDPRYAAARAKMANLFFAIGREDSRNGYGAMADDLMCGDLMQVPTWIALGMLAEATSHPCKSGEGAGEGGQDRKFAFRDGQFVNRVSGEAIPLDEPVMLFRARDNHSLPILRGYLTMASDPHHRQAIKDRMGEFAAWRAEHPDRVKEPGVTHHIRLNEDANQTREAELVAACEAYVEAYDAGTGTIHVNKQIRAALKARDAA